MLTQRFKELQGLLDPWREFEQFGRGFFDALQPATELYPPVNVWTSEEQAVVTFELPGIDPEQLDISVQGRSLSLRARRELEEPAEGYSLLRRERRGGEFTRSLDLPYLIDADGVIASYSKGILEIRLPRAEVDRPRRITVRSE